MENEENKGVKFLTHEVGIFFHKWPRINLLISMIIEDKLLRKGRNFNLRPSNYLFFYVTAEDIKPKLKGARVIFVSHDIFRLYINVSIRIFHQKLSV
jgi:hypothetical protein